MFKGLLAAMGVFAALSNAQTPGPSNAPRIAFVIGNSDYSLLPKLPHVKEGVRVISDALGKAGFEVYSVQNFKFPEFLSGDAVEFRKRLKSGTVCLVYYAGYAVQGDDDNY